VSLGLRDDTPGTIPVQERTKKSAGLAFAMSLFVPGSGQLYVRKTTRGLVTLGCFVLGAVLVVANPTDTAMWAIGFSLALVLYMFGFVDAYFAATEVNAGIDEQIDVQNPRVAVALNFMTAGLGYFYLGERTKGLVLFIAFRVLGGVIQAALAEVPVLGPLILPVAQVIMAADGYRIAKKQVKESLSAEEFERYENAPNCSRLPALVPIGLASLMAAGYVLLAVVGTIALALRRAG
jgi:TM2 domain-containing membrane protein YozV